MKKYLLSFLVPVSILTQGCAHTPTEIRALGERGRVEINQPYTQAASCVSRQMSETMIYGLLKKGINHSLRTYPDEGYAEIIGDQSTGGTYVVSIHSSGQNSSTVKIYVSNNMVFSTAITNDIKKSAINCIH